MKLNATRLKYWCGLSVLASLTNMSGQPPAAAEQERVQKQNLVAKLPPGTRTAFDLPYVAGTKPARNPDSAQDLDLYVPGGSGPFALIIYLHGGGWYSGNKDVFGATLANKFIPQGFAVASLNYRLTGDAPFPAQIQDCNAAVAWLRQNAAEYQLDPRRFGVIGHSAGAQIGALMAATDGDAQFGGLRDGSSQLQACVGISGPYDLDRVRGGWPKESFLYQDYFDRGFFGATYSQDRARQDSPVTYVHRGMPPILIVYAAKDEVVPPGIAPAFVDKLKGEGNDATLYIDPDRGHTSVLWGPAIDQALAFFRRTLGASTPAR